MQLDDLIHIQIKSSVIHLQDSIETGNTGDLDWPLGEVNLEDGMDLIYHHILDIFANGEDDLISTGKTTHLLDHLHMKYPLNIDGEHADEIYEVAKEIFMYLIGYELEDLVKRHCKLPSFISYTVDTVIRDGLIRVFNNGDVRLNQWYNEHVVNGEYVDVINSENDY